MESKTTTIKIKSDGPLGTNWQEEPTELEGLSVDIYFLLQNGSNFHDVHTAQLKFPEITRKFEHQVSTAEVIGHEQELVDYYKQITKSQFTSKAVIPLRLEFCKNGPNQS